MSIQNITDKLYAMMAADSGSSGMNHTSALAGRIYDTVAPDEAAFPHMTYFCVDSQPRYHYGARTEDVLYQLDFYGKRSLGAKAIQAIADKAFVLLREKTLTTAPSGYDRGKCRVVRRGGTMIEEDAIRVSMDVRVLATA